MAGPQRPSLGAREAPAGSDGFGPAGVLPVLLAGLLWGTTGTAQAMAPAGAQPQVVGALRLAIAGATLVLWAVVRGRLKVDRTWPVSSTAVAAASMAAYQPLFFAAVARTGVAVGTIVAIGSSPILAGLLSWAVDRRLPGLRWTLATAAAVGGVGLLALAGDSVRIDAVGVLLAVGAGAAYAAYAVGSKRLLASQPQEAVLAVVFGVAGVLLLPILLVNDLGWVAGLRGALVALHLGLLATALAYLLFVRGLSALGVGQAVTLSLIEPLTATSLGVVLLGERLKTAEAAGAGLIVLGLALISAGPRR